MEVLSPVVPRPSLSPPSPRPLFENVPPPSSSSPTPVPPGVSMQPPPPPAAAISLLPNLAQQALERLKSKKSAQEEEDDSDFKPAKKKKKTAAVVEVEEDGEELQTCCICFEPWTNSGSHRLVSLKCGHLFGFVCIEKWLRSSGGKCPQCNCCSRRSDIRVVIAKDVRVVDTSERDRALRELNEEKQLHMRHKREMAQVVLEMNLLRSKYDKALEEVERLREKLEAVSARPSSPSSSSPSSTSKTEVQAYALVKDITLPQSSKARVITYDPWQGMLAVSGVSNSSHSPGNGMAKFSTVDLGHTEYVGIHSKAGTIRDACFRPQADNATILTVAVDKTAKLTSLHSNTVLQSFSLPSPAWSCCWDQDNSAHFFCGLMNGSVMLFDVRQPSTHVHCLTRSDGKTYPVTSLAAVPQDTSSTLNCGGIMMGTLGGCVFWERSRACDAEFKDHPLHSLPQGSCHSVSFEPLTRHFFSSFPPRQSPRGKHSLFQLSNVPIHEPLSCQLLQQFPGSSAHTLMSRSQLFLRPGTEDKLLATYSDEGTKSVHVWDLSSAEELQQLSLLPGRHGEQQQEPVRDMVPFESGNASNFLAVLTASKVHICKWRDEKKA